MGFTHKRLKVKSSRTAKKSVQVEFLVDSGAVYSLVPSKILKKLGIRPYRTMDFVLADGTKISRKVGDAYYELNGDGGAAPVMFGEEDDVAILGVVTLESLGLVLDPFKRELYPMRLMLA